MTKGKVEEGLAKAKLKGAGWLYKVNVTKGRAKEEPSEAKVTGHT